jgi:hypothetical protein
MGRLPTFGVRIKQILRTLAYAHAYPRQNKDTGDGRERERERERGGGEREGGRKDLLTSTHPPMHG